MNVTETSHADWVWKPGSPAAPRDTTGWKPVQLVPENARAGRGGLPAARGAVAQTRRSGSRSTRPRDLPAGVYEGDVTVTADGRATRAARRAAASSTSRCPTRTAWTRWCTTSPRSPSCTTAATSTPPTTASRTATGSSWSTRYDEAAVRASPGRFDGTRLHARERLRGTRRRRRQPHRAARRSTARARAGTSATSAWQARRRVDDVPRPAPSRGARRSSTCPTSPARPSTPRIRTLADNVHSNPGPGGKALPVFVTKHWVPELDDADRHLVRRAAVRSTSRARRRSARAAARTGPTTAGVPTGPPS